MSAGCDRNPLSDLEFDADCRRTFWVEAPLCLLSDFRLVPNEHMTLEEKMNTITRIVLVVWVLLLIFGYRRANLFFLIALIVIVLLYYARKRRQEEQEKRKKWAGLLEKFSRTRVRDESDGSPGHERHETHAARGRNSDDGFERFEATAGNGRYTAQSTVDQRPMLPVKADRQLDQRDGATYDTVNDADAAPDDLPDEEEVDVDQEIVQARGMKKTSVAVKRNPRKPYPPTVSPSLEVKAARQANLMKAYRGGPDPKAGSKFHGYQTKNFQDDEGPAIRYTTRRLRGIAKEHPVQAAMEERTEVMAENDDAEIEDDQDEDNEENEQQEAERVEAVRQQAAAPRKRVFLPANYDMASAPPVPVVQTDRVKLTRHGAKGGRRVPVKYADSNQVVGKMNATDLMFNRAAKLEKETRSRLRADRGSQINSVFGI